MYAYDLFKAVRDQAAADPEHLDPNIDACDCSYVKKEDQELSPSCIFGHAFYDLDVKLVSRMEIWDRDGMDISEVLEKMDFRDDVTVELAEWFMRVQNRQDLGSTWGAAIELADEAFGGARQVKEFISRYKAEKRNEDKKGASN